MLALDAKITFDDNGLFRHAELAELRDLNRRKNPRKSEPPQPVELRQRPATSAVSTEPG